MSFHSVSVVGAGPLGCRIAFAIASVGIPVTLIRAFSGDLKRSELRIRNYLAREMERGTKGDMNAQRVLSDIEYTSSLSTVADSDLVIDASYDSAEARRASLATLESLVSEGAVIAAYAHQDPSAPQALARSLQALSEVLRRPDQFVGIRLVPPAAHAAGIRMESEEVDLYALPETAPGVVAACQTFGLWLRRGMVVTASQYPSR